MYFANLKEHALFSKIMEISNLAARNKLAQYNIWIAVDVKTEHDLTAGFGN